MICQKCNGTFEIKPKVRKDTKYCESCRWMTCEVCQKRKRMNTQQIENPAWGRFCSHKCEKANSAFRFKKNGYWCVKAADHPRAYERGFYYEHILVLEKKVGRLLDTSVETCHHKDGNRLNNSPENLELKTKSAHSSHHWPAVSWSEDVGIDHSKFADVRTPSKRINCGGYSYEYEPLNPMSNAKGYVAVGRKVLAVELGRNLKKNEIVRYKNGDITDNRPSNLSLEIRKYGFKNPTYIYRKGVTKGHSSEYGYITI